MNKTFNRIFFFAFILIWLGLTIVNFVIPKKKFSEQENRYLIEMPSFSFETLFNGNYMNTIDLSINDHFIFRDNWTSGQSIMEYGIGKRESNGVFIGKNALFSKINPDENVIDSNISEINKFASRTKIPTNTMIIPSAAGIQKDRLPPFAPVCDEKKIIGDINKEVNNPVPVFETLYQNKNKYIYYRTDHHWTTYGAYLAYLEWCKAIGLTPVKYNAKKINDNFNGTLYSRSGVRFVDSDTIEAYNSNNFNGCSIPEGNNVKKFNSIYFDKYRGLKDKYAYFLGPNKPVVTIYGKNKTGKKLIIFKDSYSHCLAPMMLEHFDEICLVDLRYINTDINKIINVNNYDNALFLYSLDTFSTQSDIIKVNEKPTI